MFYLRYHEQGFIYRSLCVLSHVSRNQIKESLLLKSQACCDEKWEISIHAMTIYDFYSWLDIFEEYVRYKIVQSIIARLHGVKQKEMCYILVLYFEACNAWYIIIKSWLQSKTSTSWKKDRNRCSCVIWWFLNMACQVEVCFVQRIKSSLLQCKTKKWRYKNEIWNSLLMCKV